MANEISAAPGAATAAPSAAPAASAPGNQAPTGLVSQEARFAAGIPDPVFDAGSASHLIASDADPASGQSADGGSGNPDPGAAANAGADGADGNPLPKDGEPEALKSVLDQFAFLKPATVEGDGKPGEEKKPETKPGEPVKLSEEVEKQLNPDGKATPDQIVSNARNLISNLQTLTGKQAEQIGQFRQAYQTLTQSGIFRTDDQGNVTGLDIVKALDVYGADVDQINRDIAPRGFKVVDLNGNGDGNGDPLSEFMLELVPDPKDGNPLTDAERWQEIIGDKRKHDAYIERKLKLQNDAAAAQLRRDAQAQAEMQAAKSRVDELARTVRNFNAYRPVMRAYNSRYGRFLESIPGPERVDVLLKLAVADDAPNLARRTWDAAVKWTTERHQRLAAGVLPDSGGGAARLPDGGAAGGLVSEAARRSAGIPV